MSRKFHPKKSFSSLVLLVLLAAPAVVHDSFRAAAQTQTGKPPAPGGVQSLTKYKSRIGEPGLLIEDNNLQMWVPKRYEEHSRVIFTYLQEGYKAQSKIFGGEDMPVKFSVEHYPPGSPYMWGGTDGRGTIGYGYQNLEDNSPEWLLYGVPHVGGYYEEMAHCFVMDLLNDHFYETLGMMIGMETSLRAAWNPHVETAMEQAYITFAASAAYFLDHDCCEPGITENICLTRILAHVFKTKVIDIYGWKSLTQAFSAIRKNYPLRAYSRDHVWGGFLKYLGGVIGQDLHSKFGDYGLPLARWTGEPGYETDGVERIGQGNKYRFRIKITDRERNKPTDVALHLYGVGLWSIGEFDDSDSGFDTEPHDDPIVVNFTIGQPDSQFPGGLGGLGLGQQRTTIDIHFSGSLVASKTLVIRWTPGGSATVEQFSVTLDGTFVRSSKALSGLPNPYTYVTEGFRLPPAAGKNHVLRLKYLKGDGLGWDAIQLGGCVSGRFPMSLKKGTGSSGWIYQAEVETFDSQGTYAFSGNDSVHPVFQVVGQPTVKKQIK